MFHTAAEFNLVCVIVLRSHVFSRLRLLNGLSALYDVTEHTSIKRRPTNCYTCEKRILTSEHIDFIILCAANT